MAEQNKYELTDEEIEEKLEKDWDGLDQVALVEFVQEFTVAKVKGLMEAEHKAEMDRLFEEIEGRATVDSIGRYKVEIKDTLVDPVEVKDSPWWQSLKSRYGGK